MAVTRHEARGNAREPDGGNAGTPGIRRQDSLHSKYCCFVESATRLRQVGSANCPKHFPKNVIEWWQLAHLVSQAGSPESSQTIFLGGNCLLHACDDALLGTSEGGMDRREPLEEQMGQNCKP